MVDTSTTSTSHPNHPSRRPTASFPLSGPQSFHALQTRNSRLRRQLNAANAKSTYQLTVNRRQTSTIEELQKTIDMLRKERELLVRAVTGGHEMTWDMFGEGDVGKGVGVSEGKGSDVSEGKGSDVGERLGVGVGDGSDVGEGSEGELVYAT